MPRRLRARHLLAPLHAILAFGALQLAVLLALPVSAQAQDVHRLVQGGTLWVAVDEAPLRSAQSAEAEVLLRLARGAQVRVILAQGGWSKVRETGGAEGWIYQGHLSTAQPPPALASLFDPLPQSMILAEAAETARSTRSHVQQARSKGGEELLAALDQRLTPEALENFLRQGGIGEYAKVRPQSQRGQTDFPALRAHAQAGGEAERQVGLNLAARVLRDDAKPTFGVALTRYVNLVGLTVARYAPGQPMPLRAVVLDLPEPVSFSLPGGIVMVSTGLLSALENEAQLALILAHEAAHASLGHLWAKALAAPFFRQGGFVDAQGVRSPVFASMLEDLLNIALVRGLDRTNEFDADLAAVQMGYRAGYDPLQLLVAIRRIEEAGRTCVRVAPPKTWTALHPPTSERLARLKNLLARLPQQDGLALGTDRFQSSR